MNAQIASPFSSNRSRTAGLFVVVTVAAAIMAWFLAAVAGLSEAAVVISVAVIAFVSSWLVTNARPADERRHRQYRQHRVTMIPIRTRAS